MTHATNGELPRYLELTPKSRSITQEGKHYLPGADTRSSAYWPPYPIVLERGQGCRIWDVDGTERLDFIVSFTTLVLGHSHPQVVAALQSQATRGATFASPTESQYRLAKLLRQRIPSLELLRFTSSGTEATMNCLRAARAFTGRTKIAKAEGGYHGTHDLASVSVRVDPARAGDPRRPASLPSNAGVPQSVVDEVIVFPYNDTQATCQILEAHARELAAVIVEPVLGSGGMVPAEPAFLAMLRELTQRHGIVLIFDEVMSLRAGFHGAQGHYGVTPDMTALGKVIGGGLPVGAFGGKQDIMELYNPTKGPAIAHSGSFQGNPMTMTAGLVTMELITPQVYQRLEALAHRLREGIRAVCAEFEVPVHVTGLGSLYGIHFTGGPVRSYRDVAAADKALAYQVFLGLLNEGIMMHPNLLGCVSLPMTEAEVDHHVEALRTVLARR
ncbi:MAG: aspartate aminotransferase family protein [Chloroflexi bacterium]|nr:aspartate aminotransferase family protein [Chloroflexota bacterium]